MSALRLSSIVYRLSRGPEALLVRLRHRYPHSCALERLAGRWVATVQRRWPGETARVARLPGGARLVVTLADGWHRGLYFRGVYEPQTTRLVADLLRPGDVFLDVGANVGYYACLAAARGATAHAFEPNPALTALLRRTRDLNAFGARLVVNEVAVDAADGLAELHLSPQALNTGLSSLLPLPHLRAGATAPVPTVTLDGYCARRGIARIRLVKIDVEGAEARVLAGAGRVLATLRPDAVICEVGGFADGSRPDDVLRTLAAAGYAPHELTAAGLRPWRGDGDAWRHGEQRNLCFLRAPLADTAPPLVAPTGVALATPAAG